MIWFAPVDLARLNLATRGTLMESLGIRFTEVGDDWLRGEMPVDGRTVQPAGLLHGGATVALAESVASAAAYCTVDPERFTCVGVDINATHLRSAREGVVTCVARALRIGRTVQAWGFDVADGRGRLVSTGRLTVRVLEKPPDPPGG